MPLFKIGQKLKCITGGSKGSGWRENRIGTLKEITGGYRGSDVCWFNEFPNGIIDDSLAPCTNWKQLLGEE